MVIKYAEDMKRFGPLDSLLGEFLSDPGGKAPDFAGRGYRVYRHNLLSHVGTISARVQGSYSSVAQSNGRLCYPVCYGLIQYVGLMPKENFATSCINSGVSASIDLLGVFLVLIDKSPVGPSRFFALQAV